MRMTFDAAKVRALLAHSMASATHWEPYDRPTGVGLMLVGDRGVYLMSSGLPFLPPPAPGEPHTNVVYATECNPDTMAFDDWWDAKREGFGADDGVEYLPARLIEAALARSEDADGVIALDVSPTSIRA